MYEGPKLSKEQVATLEGSTSAYLGVWFLTNVLSCGLRHVFWPDSYVTFPVVSGGRIERNYFKYYRGLPPKIEVLPGHDKVFVLLDKEAFRGLEEDHSTTATTLFGWSSTPWLVISIKSKFHIGGRKVRPYVL